MINPLHIKPFVAVNDNVNCHKGQKVMKKIAAILLIVVGAVLVQGCRSSPPQKRAVVKKEQLYRSDSKEAFVISPSVKTPRLPYPWQQQFPNKFPKITKEFFRCKGDFSHPAKVVETKNGLQHYLDCAGTDQHSLPIRDGKEFVYPILIDLLNYLQQVSRQRLFITCGHCCPTHNTYLNPAATNQTSKHLLAAEVDFYMENLEQQPEKIVKWIQDYYQQNPKYQNLSEFLTFKRFENMDKTNVKIAPWYNKEIFIKLFQAKEGRDDDNCHHYPYISIQVRYDWELQETVHYCWEKAFKGFYRR